jgi:hypothetical protein
MVVCWFAGVDIWVSSVLDLCSSIDAFVYLSSLMQQQLVAFFCTPTSWRGGRFFFPKENDA